MKWTSVGAVCALVLGLLITPAKASDDPWQALQSGEAFVIMRHAIAPGFSDPANFTLGDCSTQRNLSDEGRQQARKLGMLFKRHGIEGA